MKTAVIIPCYKCKAQIERVVQKCLTNPSINSIYLVDDACPDGTGAHAQTIFGSKINVLTHSENQGVGGAMVTGFKQALADGADIFVKIDGDGQMNPALIDDFLRPISLGVADYTKGNRFFSLRNLEDMPLLRLIGNSALSFMAKVVTGYWNIMDPNNGYIAIHKTALHQMDLDRLDKSYFFETDMLFRLNTINAVVVDVPMKAVYADEVSQLNIKRILLKFPAKYCNRFLKRIFYNYF